MSGNGWRDTARDDAWTTRPPGRTLWRRRWPRRSRVPSATGRWRQTARRGPPRAWPSCCETAEVAYGLPRFLTDVRQAMRGGQPLGPQQLRPRPLPLAQPDEGARVGGERRGQRRRPRHPLRQREQRSEYRPAAFPLAAVQPGLRQGEIGV